MSLIATVKGIFNHSGHQVLSNIYIVIVIGLSIGQVVVLNRALSITIITVYMHMGRNWDETIAY